MEGIDDPLTPAVRSMIGVTSRKVPVSPDWGIEREGLRVFVNAIMDSDPRYWDDAFARTTKFGEIITPPIYCTYLEQKVPAGVPDPLTQAFLEDPNSDGIGGLREGPSVNSSLPPLPTHLKRILNAGNEIEVYRYPSLGDRIFAQSKYVDVTSRVAKDGTAMLVVVVETTYSNQDDAVLCVMRHSTIRR
jgi:hypothetical protein